MRNWLKLWVCLGYLLSLAACNAEQEGESPSARKARPVSTATPTAPATRTGSAEKFASDAPPLEWTRHVLPIVEMRCGTPSCHGIGSATNPYVASEGLFKARRIMVIGRVSTLRDMPPVGSSQASGMTDSERLVLRKFLLQ